MGRPAVIGGVEENAKKERRQILLRKDAELKRIIVAVVEIHERIGKTG